MKNRIKKYLSILTIIALMFTSWGPGMAYAAPSAPSAPEAPSAPTQIESPSEPTSNPAPESPSAPTFEEAVNNEVQEESEEQSEEEEQQQQQGTSSQNSTFSPAPSSQPSSSPTTQNILGEQTGSQNGDGQFGDNTLQTGDATNNANLVTNANNNLGTIGGDGCCGGGASVVNSDNGTNSTNSGSVNSANTSQTFQENSARVVNDLQQSTTTGDNSASDNTGGDTYIETGDANTTGTIINAVNTNVAGVAVAEFNIVDDHTGDYILDFGTGCIVNCEGGTLAVVNSGNGSNSENDASIDDINSNHTFQTNEAEILNTMDLASNSGDNVASRNTGGDSSITTGDANVAANVLTFANNNFAGNVVYGVVNIFGDLIGDIIFPEDAITGCSVCGGSLTAANVGNGTSSDNETNVNTSNTNDLFQTNDANIENNLLIDGSTGGNSVSANTNGDSSVDTGDIDVVAQVLNVANSNIAGDWWLVIVNEAGNWVGKIMGAPEGASFAGSAGTEFAVNDSGDITAVNSGNGSESTNNTDINSENHNSLSQSNDINLVNNVKLSANTGGNKANDNTGGFSNITTGDANIVANMVNFVNNNMAGSGRLFVTVVNVFGSWTGNLITPGQQKEELAAIANNQSSGGTSEQSDDSSNGGDTQTDSNSPAQGGNNTAGGTTNNKTLVGGHTNGSNVNLNSSGEGSTQFVLGDSTDTQVAGFKAEASEGDLAAAINNKKVIRINLAYLLLFLPFAGGYLIFRKRSQLAGLVEKFKR